MSLRSPTSHPSPFSPSLGLVFSPPEEVLPNLPGFGLSSVLGATWRSSLDKVIFILCLQWETVTWHPENMTKPFHASFRDFKIYINKSRLI